MPSMSDSAAAAASSSSPPAAAGRRLVLVPAAGSRGDAQLRRFRLARLRLEAPPATPAERLGPLRRGSD
jgi:hypothetical protein